MEVLEYLMPHMLSNITHVYNEVSRITSHTSKTVGIEMFVSTANKHSIIAMDNLKTITGIRTILRPLLEYGQS